MSKATEEKMMIDRLREISRGQRLSVMTDHQVIDHLNWAKDDIDGGDLKGAIDHINQVIDSTEQKIDGHKEPSFVRADARDHHLINQNFHRALGEK